MSNRLKVKLAISLMVVFFSGGVMGVILSGIGISYDRTEFWIVSICQSVTILATHELIRLMRLI